jgi:general secretion pathway protein N
MRIPAMAALGVGAFAVFLVALAPASFVAARVSAAAPQVQFLETTGTAWHGAAQARIATPGGPFVLQSVQWRFAPARLIAGRLAFDVKVAATGLDATLQVARGLADWEIASLAAHANAGLAATLFPLAATWRPEGSVEVASERLAWNEREMRGVLNVDWKDAAVALSEVRPLGSYRIEVRGEGENAPLKVTTTRGALRISGQGKLTSPARLSFSGEARGEGDPAKALEPLLDLLGPRRPDGARSLEVRR